MPGAERAAAVQGCQIPQALITWRGDAHRRRRRPRQLARSRQQAWCGACGRSWAARPSGAGIMALACPRFCARSRSSSPRSPCCTRRCVCLMCPCPSDYAVSPGLCTPCCMQLACECVILPLHHGAASRLRLQTSCFSETCLTPIVEVLAILLRAVCLHATRCWAGRWRCCITHPNFGKQLYRDLKHKNHCVP